jgi:hypothetical protein
VKPFCQNGVAEGQFSDDDTTSKCGNSEYARFEVFTAMKIGVLLGCDVV